MPHTATRQPLFRRNRRVRRLLKLLLVLIALGLAARYLLPPLYLPAHARLAAWLFSRHPTEERAIRLGAVLADRTLPKAAGERAIRQMMQPEILMRASYSLGEDATVTIRFPYKDHFDAELKTIWFVDSAGKNFNSQPGYSSGGYPNRLRPRPTAPGEYAMTWMFNWTVEEYATRRIRAGFVDYDDTYLSLLWAGDDDEYWSIWQALYWHEAGEPWPRFRVGVEGVEHESGGPILYDVTVTVPVKFTIVE